MIDTSKCKTDEERYDAMKYEGLCSRKEELEVMLINHEIVLKDTMNFIDRIKKEKEKIENYIFAYKNTYPYRPWEDNDSSWIQNR